MGAIDGLDVGAIDGIRARGALYGLEVSADVYAIDGLDVG